MKHRRSKLTIACLIFLIVTSYFKADDLGPQPKSDAFGIFDISGGGRKNIKKTLNSLDKLGVGWIRIQHRMGERRQKNLKPLLKRDYALWITLYHRDAQNVQENGTVGFSNTKRGGFGFIDAERYKQLVIKTITPFVQELKNQGKNPGDWLVIQFGNEVAPRDTFPPDKPMRFFHGTADEYLENLAHGYDAVKSIDESIPVALQGFSSLNLEYAVMEKKQRALALNKKFLKEGKYDWVDLHLRHSIDSIEKKIHWVRQFWKGPIASTEFNGPDIRIEKYSEQKHADQVTIRLQKALDAGCRRIFYSHLVESPFVEEIYKKEGLIEKDTLRIKPAFYAYQQFIKNHQVNQ